MTRRVPLIQCAILAAFVLAGSLALRAAHAQDTPDYFRQNCMNCHTIGGGALTGPDLKAVTVRKDREWIIKFMMNPKAVVDSGDPYAAKILQESRGVLMPTLPGIDRARAEKLLDLIEAESQLATSQFRGMQISDAPFTQQDVEEGRAIFLGKQRLAAGGASCVSCHSMHDIPAFGGGRLGPDLTSVYERLEGRRGLSAWLMAPATETMLPIYKNRPLSEKEVHALVAYFEASSGESAVNSTTSRIAFLFTGLVGAAAIVFLLDAIWKRRFHAVRKTLVEAGNARGFP
jgi:mono/diheme cytochrome c family protein